MTMCLPFLPVIFHHPGVNHSPALTAFCFYFFNFGRIHAAILKIMLPFRHDLGRLDGSQPNHGGRTAH